MCAWKGSAAYTSGPPCPLAISGDSHVSVFMLALFQAPQQLFHRPTAGQLLRPHGPQKHHGEQRAVDR